MRQSSCSIICVHSGEVPCSVEEEIEQSMRSTCQLYASTHESIHSYIECEVELIADSSLKDVQILDLTILCVRACRGAKAGHKIVTDFPSHDNIH